MTPEQWLEDFFHIVDRNRLERGKALYRQGQLLDFQEKEKEDGFYAKVKGSRGKPYEVEAYFPIVEEGLPDIEEMFVECSCPDWVEFCKHSICAIIYFCNELNHEPPVFSVSQTQWDTGVNEIQTAMNEDMVSITMLEPLSFMGGTLNEMHRVVKRKLRNHSF
jgi:uncharacterized Zn finger protein